jgi:hypothetical protein
MLPLPSYDPYIVVGFVIVVVVADALMSEEGLFDALCRRQPSVST